MNPPELKSQTFFLDEINALLGMFQAAVDMDDWDLAERAFHALSQNAWDAHVLLTGDPRLRCPAVPAEPQHAPEVW